MDDLDHHPDLNDPKWLRAAERRANADVRRYRRRQLRGPRLRGLGVLAVIVLLGALGYGLYQLGGPSPQAVQLPAVTTTTERPRLDLTRPFTGTPAADWADGAAGLVVPAAAPAGPYGAEQVAEAYRRAKDTLVAAYLNRTVIERHDPGPLLDILSPAVRDEVRAKFTGEAFAPALRTADGYPLLPVDPKVSGEMSISVGEYGRLVVHTNYVFAYAFKPDTPEHGSLPRDIVALYHVATDYTLVDGEREEPDRRGVWPSSYRGYYYSMSCAASKKNRLAPAFAEPVRDSFGPHESAESYYDPKHSLDIKGSCPA